MATGYVFVPGSPSGWELASSSNLPSVVDVTDGTTTVSAVTSIDFTSGATVTSGGAGVADVAVASGSITVTDGTTTVNNVTEVDFTSNATVTDGGGGIADVAVTGGSGGMVSLFDQTLATAAASIDTGASGIASGYSSLYIIISGQVLTGVIGGNVAVTVNGDTAAHYDWEQVQGFGTTAAANAGAAATSWPVALHGNASTASYAGMSTLFIADYTGTTFYKVATGSNARPDGVTNQLVQAISLGWRSTAAINQLTVTGSGGNLAAGSRLVILGTP